MIRVNGEPVDIKLRRRPHGWVVESAGELRDVTVQRTGNGVYTVLLGRRAIEVRASGSQFDVDGVELMLDVDDPRDAPFARAPGESEGRQTLRAPMPGKVVRVLVSEGDAVERDQGLIVIEAMKMQNAMKSPKAGRVAELRVREGEAVAAGDTLAVVE